MTEEEKSPTKKTKVSCIHELNVDQFQKELGEEIEYLMDLSITTRH